MDSMRLAKLLATVFLFVLAITCLGIGAYDMLFDKPIPDLVKMFLGVAIGYAGKVLGFQIGAETALTNPSIPAIRYGKIEE